jgi:hypothetical protein
MGVDVEVHQRIGAPEQQQMSITTQKLIHKHHGPILLLTPLITIQKERNRNMKKDSSKHEVDKKQLASRVR